MASNIPKGEDIHKGQRSGLATLAYAWLGQTPCRSFIYPGTSSIFLDIYSPICYLDASPAGTPHKQGVKE